MELEIFSIQSPSSFRTVKITSIYNYIKTLKPKHGHTNYCNLYPFSNFHQRSKRDALLNEYKKTL